MLIAVINGPNLRVVGHQAYGPETLEDIEVLMENRARKLGVDLHLMQSDHEGEIVQAINALTEADGFIINASAYAHTSLAIADALAASGRPAIEVHFTNIYAREPARHTSAIAPVVWGQIAGFGYRGYLAALDLLHDHLGEARAAD